jgi:segregation and condensation protein B
VSKRKKTSGGSSPNEVVENDSVTTRAVVPPEVMERAMGGLLGDAELPAPEDEPAEDSGDAARGSVRDIAAIVDRLAAADDAEAAPDSSGSPFVPEASDAFDAEMTVNLVGELPLPGRDDLDAPTVAASGDSLAEIDSIVLQRKHLRGLLEALVFASDSPITPKELAKLASAPQKQVRELLDELKVDYSTRGIHLDEVAGGWVFRTSAQYAPFVRDLTKQKPVRLTRAQVETLAIIAYRQPITRPEVDDVRGVDSGPVLKLLLERDLVRILGKRDEPGRPIIYGTTGQFLEFFGLKSLKDLPTLREFTELSDESRADYEGELGESPEDGAAEAEARAHEGEDGEGVGVAEASNDDGEAPDSMRIPIREDALEEDDVDPESHASDDDGPTLTSEAPHALDDDDD